MRAVVLTWLGLVALTTLTFLASKLHLGAWALPVSLFIATAKACLILFVFMGLSRHGGAGRIAFLVALVLLGSLALLSWTDAATRWHPARAPGPFIPSLTSRP